MSRMDSVLDRTVVLAVQHSSREMTPTRSEPVFRLPQFPGLSDCGQPRCPTTSCNSCSSARLAGTKLRLSIQRCAETNGSPTSKSSTVSFSTTPSALTSRVARFCTSAHRSSSMSPVSVPTRWTASPSTLATTSLSPNQSGRCSSPAAAASISLGLSARAGSSSSTKVDLPYASQSPKEGRPSRPRRSQSSTGRSLILGGTSQPPLQE